MGVALLLQCKGLISQVSTFSSLKEQSMISSCYYPFLSLEHPCFPSEAKCNTLLVKMSFLDMNNSVLQKILILISKTLHVALF